MTTCAAVVLLDSLAVRFSVFLFKNCDSINQWDVSAGQLKVVEMLLSFVHLQGSSLKKINKNDQALLWREITFLEQVQGL